MATPEGKIQNEIMMFLRSIGVYCWINKTMGTYDPIRKVYRKNFNAFSIKGTSDILGIIQGRMLAIEVKTPTGRLTDEQRIFIAKVNSEGGISFVARSVEQAAEQLLSHFPKNDNLKRFCKDYVSSKGTDH